MRNPLEYSRKCHDLPVKHDFKLNPTLKTLKNWWASETVTVQTKATAITSSHGRNLLEDLGSESDSDDNTASRKKKKAKGKPKKNLLSSSDEEAPQPKISVQKRKLLQLELSEDGLGGQVGPSGAPV